MESARDHLRYLLALATGFAASAALWLALVAFQTGTPTASSQWTADIIEIKQRIAASKPSPKLLVSAGSNALYGIRTERIEAETGVPSVNMGMAAGVGADYLLGLARRAAGPGDVILLALEYVHYADATGPDETRVDYVFSRDPAFLGRLRTGERVRMAFAMPPARLWEGVRGRIAPHPVAETGPYRATTLNAHGDETKNRPENRSENALRRVESARSYAPYLERVSGRGRTWDAIDSLVAWARANDVVVLATWPSVIRSPDYDAKKPRWAFQRIEAFYRSRGVPVLGRPEDFMYPRADFYDTGDHLASEAMERRTATLTALMRPHLERARGRRAPG